MVSEFSLAEVFIGAREVIPPAWYDFIKNPEYAEPRSSFSEFNRIDLFLKQKIITPIECITTMLFTFKINSNRKA